MTTAMSSSMSWHRNLWSCMDFGLPWFPPLLESIFLKGFRNHLLRLPIIWISKHKAWASFPYGWGTLPNHTLEHLLVKNSSGKLWLFMETTYLDILVAFSMWILRAAAGMWPQRWLPSPPNMEMVVPGSHNYKISSAVSETYRHF